MASFNLAVFELTIFLGLIKIDSRRYFEDSDLFKEVSFCLYSSFKNLFPNNKGLFDFFWSKVLFSGNRFRLVYINYAFEKFLKFAFSFRSNGFTGDLFSSLIFLNIPFLDGFWVKLVYNQQTYTNKPALEVPFSASFFYLWYYLCFWNN